MQQLLKHAIRAFWRSSHGLTPLPELSNYQVELRGDRLVVSAPGVMVEGAPTSLCALVEKLLWLEGWSSLYDVRRGQAPDMLLLDTYEGLAESLLTEQPRFDEPTRVMVLSVLADAEVEQARELLDELPQDLADAHLPYDADKLVRKIFGGRRRASASVLLRNTVELFDDPRPLVRRQITIEAADLMTQTRDANPYRLASDITPLAEKALDDEHPTVREAAALLLEQLSFYMVSKGAFDVAAALLDRAVDAGPNYALVHARRWKVRLALGDITGAAEDWTVFYEAVQRLISQIPQHDELARALAFYRVDGLLTAAEAAHCHATGWPTERTQRDRCKVPKPPAADQREVFESIRVEAAREGLDMLEQLVPTSERRHVMVPNQLTMHGLRHGNMEPIFTQLRRLAQA
jgi:hypothetical protein